MVLFNNFSSSERKDYDYGDMVDVVAGLLFTFNERIGLLFDSGETALKHQVAGEFWAQLSKRIGKLKLSKSLMLHFAEQNIAGLLRFIGSADIVVTPDTFVMHAAIAAGKWVITPWGNCIENAFLRWAPQSNRYLPLITHSVSAEHKRKPLVDKALLERAIELAVKSVLIQKSSKISVVKDLKQPGVQTNGNDSLDFVFKDNKANQGKRVLADIMNLQAKLLKSWKAGNSSRVGKNIFLLLAALVDFEETMHPAYRPLAFHQFEDGRDYWREGVMHFLVRKKAPMAVELLLGSTMLRFASFLNTHLELTRKSSSPVKSGEWFMGLTVGIFVGVIICSILKISMLSFS
jgi:hypothetical protein